MSRKSLFIDLYKTLIFLFLGRNHLYHILLYKMYKNVILTIIRIIEINNPPNKIKITLNAFKTVQSLVK